MTAENTRMHILDMIEAGKINAEEGLALLHAIQREDREAAFEGLRDSAVASLAGDQKLDVEQEAGGFSSARQVDARESEPQVETPTPQENKAAAYPEQAAHFRRWWQIPFWTGVSVTILGGLLMYWVLEASGVGFWLLFSGTPFLFGLVIMVLAWQARNAPWLHLRVEQEKDEWPRNIVLSFPIPIRPTAWFLRTFGHRIPALEDTPVDEIIQALGQSVTPDNPIFIEVEEGDRVQVFIG
jgi:hypothetical protein